MKTFVVKKNKIKSNYSKYRLAMHTYTLKLDDTVNLQVLCESFEHLPEPDQGKNKPNRVAMLTVHIN